MEDADHPEASEEIDGTVPDDWVQVDARGEFTFFAPPDLKAIPVQGVDSLVGKYENENIQLFFDYGPWGSIINGQGARNYQSKSLEIDGCPALIVSFFLGKPGLPYYAALSLDAHDRDGDRGRRGRLCMSADCRRTEDVVTAKRIFLSIRFL